MANQLSTIPWEVDTPGVLIDSKAKVKEFYWFAPDSTGDELILNDRNGNVVLRCVAEADGQSQAFYKGGTWYDGLTLDTIDSGILYIDLR